MQSSMLFAGGSSSASAHRKQIRTQLAYNVLLLHGHGVPRTPSQTRCKSALCAGAAYNYITRIEPATWALLRRLRCELLAGHLRS